jgi:hypothetical protein
MGFSAQNAAIDHLSRVKNSIFADEIDVLALDADGPLALRF